MGNMVLNMNLVLTKREENFCVREDCGEKTQSYNYVLIP